MVGSQMAHRRSERLRWIANQHRVWLSWTYTVTVKVYMAPVLP